MISLLTFPYCRESINVLIYYKVVNIFVVVHHIPFCRQAMSKHKCVCARSALPMCYRLVVNRKGVVDTY